MKTVGYFKIEIYVFPKNHSLHIFRIYVFCWYETCSVYVLRTKHKIENINKYFSYLPELCTLWWKPFNAISQICTIDSNGCCGETVGLQYFRFFQYLKNLYSRRNNKSSQKSIYCKISKNVRCICKGVHEGLIMNRKNTLQV